jgi:hypothetical protein
MEERLLNTLAALIRGLGGAKPPLAPPNFLKKNIFFYKCVLKKMFTKAEKASIETGKQK